jgi:TcpE family
MAERFVIRSYRRVFEVDRRIYRIDRWTLPVPGGVPLRGLGYFTAGVLAIIAADRLPGVGALVDAVSPPLRYVILPLLVAMVATQAAPDGRAAHRFAWDWLRLRLRARRRCAGRVVPLEGETVAWHGRLGVAWDRHGAELHRARVRGPVRVTFTVPVRLDGRGRRLIARPAPDERGPATVVLCGDAVLEVRP